MENTERNDEPIFAGWREIVFEDSHAVRLGEERRGPITMHWAEFNTNNPEDRNIMLGLVVHPLEALMGESSEGRLRLPGIERDWRIVTSIPNHERGLNPRITFTSITCVPEDKTCHVSHTKQSDKDKK